VVTVEPKVNVESGSDGKMTRCHFRFEVALVLNLVTLVLGEVTTPIKFTLSSPITIVESASMD
jgi:hypothetical protein